MQKMIRKMKHVVRLIRRSNISKSTGLKNQSQRLNKIAKSKMRQLKKTYFTFLHLRDVENNNDNNKHNPTVHHQKIVIKNNSYYINK